MLLHQGLCLNLAVTWTSKPLEETQPGLFYTEFCKIRHLQFRVEGLNVSWFGRTLSFINIQIQIQWNANQNFSKMDQVLLPGLLTGLHLQTANGLPSMLIYSFKVSCDGGSFRRKIIGFKSFCQVNPQMEKGGQWEKMASTSSQRKW